MDYEILGAAIAARFATATTPAEEDAIALATTDLPDQLGQTPAVLVFPPEEAALEWGPGSTLYSVQLWPVRLLTTQGGTFGRRMTRLTRWRKAVLLVVVGQIQLGIAGVDWAELRSISVAEITYAETPYDALDMVVAVKIREQVAAQA